MPYCPRCLVEYVEGTTTCEDCGAFLLAGPRPEATPPVDLRNEKNVKLVPVRVFFGGTAQMEADLARNILQTQGIPSLPSGEFAAKYIPVLDVPLLVREEDLEKATQALEDYLGNPATTGAKEGEPSDE